MNFNLTFASPLSLTKSSPHNLSITTSVTPLQFHPPSPTKITHKKSFAQAAASPSPTSTTTKETDKQQHSQSYVDAGLIPNAGVTGTICINLFPIPILGNYAWFLTVYKRSISAFNAGPFTAYFESASSKPNPNSITLSFQPSLSPSLSDIPTSKSFKGIAAGNLNVKSLLESLNHPMDKPYELRFFEKGSSELFFQRNNELHTNISPFFTKSMPKNEIWTDMAPTYRTTLRTKTYEIRKLYTSAGQTPKNPAIFEWFSMNLFPIFPLAEYSAFVCVWRQRRDTSSIAIDKLGRFLKLSVFDPLPLPDGVDVESVPCAATFAVRRFKGAASDESITRNYLKLVQELKNDNSVVKIVVDDDYRVVIDNNTATFTWDRWNEIWVQVDIISD